MSDTIISGKNTAIIGMVHLPPLPGSPRFGGTFDAILRRAVRDAVLLAEGGVDAVMVENFGDVPFFPDRVPSETVAAMAVAASAVRRAVPLPIGVNVLRNDGLAALGVAAVVGAAAVRINILSGAAVTDQGVIEGRACEIMRKRAFLGGGIAVWADVMVKHSAPLGEYPLAQAAKDVAYRGLADALIVSGSGTGEAVSLEELRVVREAVPDRPLLLGSGVNPGNLDRYLPYADGFIVGTALKKGGVSDAPVSLSRVRRFVDRVKAAGGRR
ncbi:MAG TPA: BtpA/SgcQ family protein [bacterium]|nr:BtpA/SgcQ family protein [bacterium]HPQ65928.1 BtpA/SgcQ family protein [bacterium]